MAGKTLSAADQVSGGSYLPGLIGVAAALSIWMLAQPVADEARSMQQQIALSGQARTAGGEKSLAEMQRLARQAASRRSAIEQRLQLVDSPAVANAKVLHELRQACAAVAIQNCAVKYVDDAVSPGVQTATASTITAADAAATPATLGLSRSKAQVSGVFQDMEITKLINQLERQTVGVWRISGLTVRSNRFELDAELINRPRQSSVGSNKP